MIALLAVLVLPSVWPAGAQTASPSPAPETLAAAKELVQTMRLAKQYEAILPAIITALKPSIVQGRPEVDRQYDALTPILLEGFRARLSEMSDSIAVIYANNFSTEDLQAIIAFYKSPAGQRMLEKLPSLTQQTLSVGTKFGQSVGEDLRKKMIEELRKKGVDL
jgi:hypothetical protein